MADRPILFSGPMVRALLAGTKTQTRRVLTKPYGTFEWVNGDWRPLCLKFIAGDHLYVREAWRVSRKWNQTAPRDLPPRTLTTFFEAGGSMGGTEAPPKDRPRSAAEYVHDLNYPVGPHPEWVGRLRAGMHMPRWASRLTLTVTEVRVQRLQDISEDDAKAEGVERIGAEYIAKGSKAWDEGPNFYTVDCGFGSLNAPTAAGAYRLLWDHLNADRGFGWDANPWVVAVSFTVALRNIDAEKRP